MTTLETEPVVMSEAEIFASEFQLPDIGELIASGQLELSESQENMLAFMASLEPGTRIARRDVLPYGEGHRFDRQYQYTSLIKKIQSTPGLGEFLQCSGVKNQRRYWFGFPDENTYSPESSEPNLYVQPEETPEADDPIVELEWDEFIVNALCRDIDPNVFFPKDTAGVTAAKKICQECVVREECLEYALNHRIDHGVWGGASERERRRILKRRRRQAQA